MDPATELAGGAARATSDSDRWTLVSDREHLASLAAAVATQPGAEHRRWVVSDPVDADAVAAHAVGLTVERDVLQLRRTLPVEPAVAGKYPPVDVRSLRPGSDDEEAWVACNNRAFAGHPDQAAFTLDRLHRVMREPWFDPAGFLLHEDGGALLGFCWTKIHHQAEPPLGEIFVIGVDPAAGGRGLGGAMTLAGLAWLVGRGITVGMLYVDADNAAARGMYDRLGFHLHHTDCVFDSEPEVPPRGGYRTN